MFPNGVPHEEIEEQVLLLFELNKTAESSGISAIKLCLQSTQWEDFCSVDRRMKVFSYKVDGLESVWMPIL